MKLDEITPFMSIAEIIAGMTLIGGPVQRIEDHAAVCPNCGSDFLRHVEDIPAIRPVVGWCDNGQLNVDSCIDDHDYDSGHGGHLGCGNCGWMTDDDDFDCNEIAWDGQEEIGG